MLSFKDQAHVPQLEPNVTPWFCIHVHGVKSKEDVHYFRRQRGHGPPFFFSFLLYHIFTPPWGNCNKWWEHNEVCNRTNYLMTLLPIHTLGCFFSLVNYYCFSAILIIFKFFHPNNLQNWSSDWKLGPRRCSDLWINVYYHAYHCPRVSWKCAKSPLVFFNFSGFF